MLKAEGKISDPLIEKLMAWHHSGFSVHAGKRIARDDRNGQKALAEYILRNAFSEQKACPGPRSGITYIEDTGTVIYRSGMTHGGNKKNFEVFSAEEFIAAITQHIPDKSFQMVRYYGWYSSRTRLGSADLVMSRRLPRAIPRQPCSMCPTISHAGCRPKHGGSS